MAETESDFSSVDPPAYAEIIVVRHGETEWNADGRIQGHLDVELNEVGRQQAAAVADRLSKEPRISAIYSSDLKRALETACIIATLWWTGVIKEGKRYGTGNLGLEFFMQRNMVIKDSNLRERNLGDLQGLVLHETANLNPKLHKAFLSHRTDQEIPRGESLDQLYQRCTSSLQIIGRKHRGERVVVVTHGGVIRALCKRASPNGRPEGKIPNTSVNTFHLSDGDDVSHLDQTGFLKSGFGGDGTSG